ncbi:MAG: O-methyltransferase [Candidatus Altimarinota bacterium]
MNIDIFLEDLKKHGIENEIPNISQVNARFLRDLIKIGKIKNMLEIGTANGFSAINFALELKELGGKLTTIEFSKLSYDIALENFKLAGVSETINAINGNALDVIPTLEESYDFVFIDGMKRRTKDFLELVWDKVEEGGIIVIDDVIKFREKMIGFWEYLEDNHIKYNIIPIDIDDGIVMIVK